MPAKKTTFDLVLMEFKPDPRAEPDYDYDSDPVVYAFAGFYHPGLDTEEQLQTLQPGGKYVVYSGEAKLNEKGMTLPKTLKLQDQYHELEVEQPTVKIRKRKR